MFCFSEKGQVKWEFVPGRKVSAPKEDFSDIYFVTTFQAIPKTGQHASLVIANSVHSRTFPNQVVALDGRTGANLGEYWHSGHLLHLAIADLDGDGVEEILLAGVNNGYKSQPWLCLTPGTSMALLRNRWETRCSCRALVEARRRP